MSLRARLTLIILLPLMLISVAVGLWAFSDAQSRAKDRFDRSLLSTALAISRDVAVSGGDALSLETRDLLRDTSGGAVFYHVYAPDGVFVTGYATPPVPPAGANLDEGSQFRFDAVYQGRPVRALRYLDLMTIEGLSGEFTITVWQDIALRDSFVRDLSLRTFRVIATLIVAVALIVWFGVRVGLGPLLDLQEAIEKRSSDDLSEIRRPIPAEAQGIVGTLNRLLRELTATLQTKDAFISNAAHQLLNPIAGALVMSEAVQSAPTLADARERSAVLNGAVREISVLAKNLLAFERAKSLDLRSDLSLVDPMAVVQEACDAARAHWPSAEATLKLDLAEADPRVMADPVLLREAVVNLINNAFAHGGPVLTAVRVRLAADAETVSISVSDDGKGLSREEFQIATERFGQVEPAQGNGLGLSISGAVAEGLGGALSLRPSEPGLIATMTLPRAGYSTFRKN